MVSLRFSRWTQLSFVATNRSKGLNFSNRPTLQGPALEAPVQCKNKLLDIHKDLRSLALWCRIGNTIVIYSSPLLFFLYVLLFITQCACFFFIQEPVPNTIVFLLFTPIPMIRLHPRVPRLFFGQNRFVQKMNNILNFYLNAQNQQAWAHEAS